jgi:hypothetical protein
MTEDFTLYVTKVEQTLAAVEDRTDDPGVPRVSGGEVVVTAQAGEAFLEFARQSRNVSRWVTKYR